jgi:glycerol-3-phosphate cytidylyltransferase
MPLMAAPRTVITFGTFDVFHVGHLRVIERAAALGDRLVVGVSADALNLRKKGREPVFSQSERMAIVGALKMVDEVFVEESLELKRDYIEQYAADVLVMGDDWEGKFDEFRDICEVVYLSRTPAISTTALIEKISSAT